MSAPDREGPLAALAAELRALPAGDRRAILDLLTPVERVRILSLLGGEDDEAPFDAIESHFSVPLAARIGQARDLGAPPAGAARMTATARQAVLEAAQALAETEREAGRGRRGARSLLGALGALVTR